MLISLNNINVTYGEKNGKVQALYNVSMEIEEGEFLVIMGKSGCGKSTLLNVLGTISKPTGGEYSFNEEEINKLNDSKLAKFRNKNIGFVVQNFALLNDKSVYDNIALPLKYMQVGRKEQKERVHAILEEMELSDKKNKYPFELSGGQQQRVAIARALVTNPKLLLADEPTGALDEETGKKIMGLLKKINENGTTIVMVTHDKDFAKYGSRCIMMKDGQVCQTKNERK